MTVPDEIDLETMRLAKKSTLPDSRPRGYPHSTPRDIEERPFRQVFLGSAQRFFFGSNSVKTSRYELWSFLPMFLLEEFDPMQKIANVYFLVVSCMQTIPAITNTKGLPTTLLPLTAVLFIAAIFKLLEDAKRHRADTLANSSSASVLDAKTGTFKTVMWSNVEVGDFIRVRSREAVPADLILIQTAEDSDGSAKGLAYVETKSLDGETNLKVRLLYPLHRTPFTAHNAFSMSYSIPFAIKAISNRKRSDFAAIAKILRRFRATF
jgi:magnesium-transporting ATPase (P-type)